MSCPELAVGPLHSSSSLNSDQFVEIVSVAENNRMTVPVVCKVLKCPLLIVALAGLPLYRVQVISWVKGSVHVLF